MTDTKSAVRRRIVLLDAHAILHRAYHALPDFATAAGEPTGALYGVSAMLIKIIEQLKPDYIIACYDVKGPTHRHQAFKEYKAQRKQIDDDLIAQIERSREIFAAFGIPIYDKQGYEADDILGTIVEQTSADDGLEIVIASGDMDTMQLIHGDKVKVYTLKKGLNDTIMYDEDAVRERYGFGPELIPDYKGLRGDPSDNIPGVKGVGEKTATALITAFGTIDNIYRELDAGHDDSFVRAGVTPRLIQVLRDNREEAQFSKVLATISRNAPIQFVLPPEMFRSGLDMSRVQGMWERLEFRTLSQRLKGVLESKNDKKPPAAKARPAAGGEQPSAATASPVQSAIAKDAPREGINQSMFVAEQAAGQAGGLGSDSTSDPGSGPVADPVAVADLERTALALWVVDSNITDPDKDDILSFANTDDYSRARETIMSELDKRSVRRVYEDIELPLIPILHRMQERGIRVDRAVLAGLSEEYHRTADDLERRIWEMSGSQFNINSPKQLGDVLFDALGLGGTKVKKTAGGARSTKESELEKLRGSHPVIPLILEYRELQKLLGTYIDAIPPLLDGNDRLHTHFVQTGSTTGRMASHNPNIQNIPIRTELGRAIRSAFVAEKGHSLVALDYSQMELRIAAFLSGDDKLIGIFRNGEDVHRSVASYVFRVPQAEVDQEMRRRAKIINFGILYGMGVLALKQNLGTTRAEAQKFYDDYFAEFATLAQYLERVKTETAKRGYTETYYGRRRYFAGIKSKLPYVRAQAERMAINAPIQGTEADVIKLAMVRVEEYLSAAGLSDVAHPLLQVHDELIYEIRDDHVTAVSREIERIMESVIDPKETKGVVLEVTAHIGKDWGELK